MGKIEKAPGGKTNSFVMTVTGMSVNPQKMKGQHINAGVMCTSDEHGETLSLFDPTTKKQIIVPFEEVRDLINHTRKARKQEGSLI